MNYEVQTKVRTIRFLATDFTNFHRKQREIISANPWQNENARRSFPRPVNSMLSSDLLDFGLLGYFGYPFYETIRSVSESVSSRDDARFHPII
jgi:hypothetical protein